MRAQHSQRNDRPQDQSTRAQMGIQGLPRFFAVRRRSLDYSQPRRGQGNSGWRRGIYREGSGVEPNRSGPDRVTSRAEPKAQSAPVRQELQGTVGLPSWPLGSSSLPLLVWVCNRNLAKPSTVLTSLL